MPMLSRHAGATSQIVAVFVPNATVSTGAGLANVSASSLSISWWRDDMTSTSTYTASTGSLGTWGASTVAQVNSTFALGWYQVSVPNGVFASGNMSLMHLYGNGSMAPVPVLFDLSTKALALGVTNPVAVSTMATPVGVSSASVTLGVSTIAVSEKLVGVSTIAVGEKLVGVSTIAVSQKLVGVSTLSVPVGVSSASVDFGVSTIAVAQKLVGVSTIAAAQKLIGVSSITVDGLTNFFDTGAVFFSTAVVSSVVYEIATNVTASVGALVGVSSITTPVGVSSASVNFGVSTIAAAQKLVGVSTMTTPVGVSSASVDFGVSTIAAAQKLVGVSTMATPVGVSSASVDFGVSSSVMVSSNVVQINGVTIVGDGSGTPFNV